MREIRVLSYNGNREQIVDTLRRIPSNSNIRVRATLEIATALTNDSVAQNSNGPASSPIARPYVIFQLLSDDDSRFSYPQEKLIHIAGMVRHLAIDVLTGSPPEDVPADWVQRYVAGHT